MKYKIERSDTTTVFETKKITLMRKKDFFIKRNEHNDYVIYIHFDNGKVEELYYINKNERDKEWERILECCEMDDNPISVSTYVGHLTTGE